MDTEHYHDLIIGGKVYGVQTSTPTVDLAAVINFLLKSKVLKVVREASPLENRAGHDTMLQIQVPDREITLQGSHYACRGRSRAYH